MKRLVIGAAGLAILSAMTLASSAQAASFGHGRHLGKLTPYERAGIARSQANLNRLKWRVRADGRLNLWERMQVNAAQARHNALVYRFRHN